MLSRVDGLDCQIGGFGSNPLDRVEGFGSVLNSNGYWLNGKRFGEHDPVTWFRKLVLDRVEDSNPMTRFGTSFGSGWISGSV